MTPDREQHLIAQVEKCTDPAEVEAMRAQIVRNGEGITPELLRAMMVRMGQVRG